MMKFKNKRAVKPENKKIEDVRKIIPKSILKKLATYTPTDDLTEVQEISFLEDLTDAEKTTLLNLFPELKEE